MTGRTATTGAIAASIAATAADDGAGVSDVDSPTPVSPTGNSPVVLTLDETDEYVARSSGDERCAEAGRDAASPVAATVTPITAATTRRMRVSRRRAERSSPFTVRCRRW